MAYPNLNTDNPNDFTNMNDFLKNINNQQEQLCQMINGSNCAGGPGHGGLAGIDYDPASNTISFEDGRKFTPGDFANETTMKNAGMTDAEIKDIMGQKGSFAAQFGSNSKDANVRAILSQNEKLAEAKKKALEAAGITTSGASYARTSRGSSNSVNPGEQGSQAEDPFKNLLRNFKNKKNGAGRGIASLAEGASLRHGNDLIGHKEENIFQMIHRRYRQKVQEGQFVNP
ncbi:MAG: hypothetical protein R2827_01095 [Bdellovibrionales bacterium]